MPIHVLIGPADALSAPEVTWSLLDAGFIVTAYTSYGSKPPLRKVRGITVAEITNPKTETKKAICDLEQVVGRYNCGLFLPLDDYAVWLCLELSHRIPALKLPIQQEQIELALNKWKQIQSAREAGLSVPETLYCCSEAEALTNQYFPCFVKGAIVIACSNDRLFRDPGYVCSDEEELKKVASNWDFARPMLIQPCINGRGEGVFGLATMNKVGWWSSHRRIRMMNPQGSGSSACEAIPPNEDLLAPITKLLGASSWRGMFMIEFLRGDDGTAWFMEINGRAWGSMALARCAGFEYPAWTAKNLVDPYYQPVVPLPRFPLRCRHLGRELIHLLIVLKGPKSRAGTKWPGFFDTVFQLLQHQRCDHWYNWRKSEPGVFWSDAWATVTNNLLKKMS